MHFGPVVSEAEISLVCHFNQWGNMVRGKILVVEDNELYAEILKLYLEKKGHTVYVVRDGESACKEVLEIGPDIILLVLSCRA